MSSQPLNIVKERKTYKRFMEIELWRKPELETLYPILCSLESACRDVNRLMRRVSTDNLEGFQGTLADVTIAQMNIQGENQKKLDVIANRIMKNALCCTGNVGIIASEEDDEACLCSSVIDNRAFTGEYAAVFDPLDGSSNIDPGLPTGTIFGIYKNPPYLPVSDMMATLKQRGNSLVVAGYCLYSASCHFVITLRTGVHMFTLDDVTGEFYLTRSNVAIPEYGSIYSFNDANSLEWEPCVQTFVQDFKTNKLREEMQAPKSTKSTARYMGALVADIHNILLNGGVYGYPGTVNNPDGKLRLLYETNPISLLLEEAGGAATDGRNRILDITVDKIHQRTSFFGGSKKLLNIVERYCKEADELRNVKS